MLEVSVGNSAVAGTAYVFLSSASGFFVVLAQRAFVAAEFGGVLPFSNTLVHEGGQLLFLWVPTTSGLATSYTTFVAVDTT